MGTFAGKVALVTGGASGIGLALSTQLVEAGATVVLADIDAERAAKTAEQLGDGTRGVQVDVRDASAVKALVESVAKEHSRLDYLFNNAGISIVGEVVDFSIDDWNRIVDTNLRGIIHGVVAAYPLMIEQGFGHIVNTSSVCGLIPSPGLTAYATTKYAIVGLSVSLREEAAYYGVKVSVSCPGMVQTPLLTDGELRNIDRDADQTSLPLKPISAEACARDILRGVRKNRPIIMSARHAKVLATMNRLAPWLVRRLVKKGIDDSRKKRR